MNKLIYVVLGMLFMAVMGILWCRYFDNLSVVNSGGPIAMPPQVQTRNDIPDVYELQEFLFVRGYYAGPIDGICGRGTLDAWDRYICDKAANKMSNN